MTTQLHENHRQRMRERIAKEGFEHLQEHEILEYLLYPFVPRKDTNPIAHQLLQRFGTLAKVLESDAEMLNEVSGVTANAAHFLSSLPAVYRRYEISRFGPRPVLDTHEKLCAYATAMLANRNEEHIYLLALDARGGLISRTSVGEGEAAECKLTTRKLVMECHNLQASNVYLVHNHPSGVVDPSEADVEFTKWALSALETLDVNLVDHIIVAGRNVYSFRKDGRLDSFRKRFNVFMGFEKISDRQ